MLRPLLVLNFLRTNWQWSIKDFLMSKVALQTMQVVLNLFLMSVLGGHTDLRFRTRTWTLCRMPGGRRSTWPSL